MVSVDRFRRMSIASRSFRMAIVRAVKSLEYGVLAMNADGTMREHISDGCHSKWSPDGSS